MAAQDAELQLRVSLDLSFFKQQLSGLGTAAAGYQLPINIRFDRRSVQKELNDLGANIRRRNYRLEVGTNLSAEIDKARKLAEVLNALPKTNIATGRVGTSQAGYSKTALGKIKVDDIKALYRAAANAGLVAFEEETAKTKKAIADKLSEVGKNSIAGLLNGLHSGDAQIASAAKSLGTILIASIKDVLGIASPSKETAKLGKFAAEGFGVGFVSAMVKVERQIAQSIRLSIAQAFRDGLSNAPAIGGALVGIERQLAAGIQRAVSNALRTALKDGLSASVKPGTTGAGVGALGGGVTGAVIGGAKALGGVGAAGLAKLGAGGALGIMGRMGKFSTGDTSGLTSFVQDAVHQALQAALGSGGQGALLGAAAVAGVAGAAGLASGFGQSLIRQVAEAISKRILEAITSTGSSKGIVQVVVTEITTGILNAARHQLKAAIGKPGLSTINWPSSIPLQSSKSVGGMAGGRMLPGAAAMQSLPGISFTSQKRLIGDILNPALKEALRNAANAFVDEIRRGINQAVRSVSVRDLGSGTRNALPAGRVAGFLAPGVGRAPSPYSTGALGGETQAQLFARREREARMRSDFRGIDVMGGGAGRTPSSYSYAYKSAKPLSAIVPYSSPGALVRQQAAPPGGGGTGGGGGGGGGFPGGMGGFGGAMASMKLPGSGIIRELGDEFGMATKQVVLFGTAYKALSFITSFPAQVGEAVGALQSFRNTLKAISPTAKEAQISNQFILDIVDRYNVPLQSARDGFTKLYASMAPAGFKGDEIRALFTGVSQAAATFGMSADKVDRVNYAFAQMASKGQVMSEELKGQLGDVLPGAMGIFAEAAGFKGPDAIQKFSKALEDGAYKGEAMRGLLKNVTIGLTKEFGPGAEGAARTFQGAINRMQNSTRLLYEAFEPVAVGFLNTVVVPITAGLKTITDGFNAFFTNTQAKTSGGMVFAQELEKLKPTFKGIRANIMALLPTFQVFGQTILGISKFLLQIAGNPFAGYLARLYLIIMPLNMALNLMKSLWAANSLQLLLFNTRIGQGTGTLTAFRAMMRATGSTAAVTAASIRGAELALKAFAASTLIGLAIVGIGMIAEAFMTAGAKADAARQKMSQFADSVKQLGAMGDVVGTTAAAASEKAMAGRIKQAKSLLQEIKGGKKTISLAQQQELANLGLTSNMAFLKEQGQKGLIVQEMPGAINANIAAAQKGYLEAQNRIKQSVDAITVAKGKQVNQEKELEKIPGDGGKAKSLESYYSLEDALAKNLTQSQIDEQYRLFEYRKELANSYYDLEEARADSFHKDAIRLAKQLSDIQLEKQKTMLDAAVAVKKAQGSVKGGAGMPGYITGDPSSPNYQSDHGGANYHDHLSFPDRKSAEDAYRKLASANIKVTEFLGKSPVGTHTSGSSHYSGLAFDVPGSQVPPGQEPALSARVRQVMGAGELGAPRQIKGNEKRQIIAEQKTQIEQSNQLAINARAEATALQKAENAVQLYIAAQMPIAEQQLQNQLTQKRIDLLRQGVPSEVIDKEIKLYEIQEKGNISVNMFNDLVAKKIMNAAQAQKAIDSLRTSLALYTNQVKITNMLTPAEQFEKNMDALRKRQALLLGPMDSKGERRVQLQQEQPTATPMQIEQQLNLEETNSRLEKFRNSVKSIASSIGDSFGEAFKGIITGTSTVQQAFANLFQSVASSFADMVAKMIAEWLKTQMIQGIQSLLSFLPGFGGNFGSIAPGPVAKSAGVVPKAGYMGPAFANGGIAIGGFKAFADGGIVSGPTLGLVGEGRYNEAVIPMPNGRSVPVDLGGAMGGDITSNIVVNVNNGQAQSNGTGGNASDFGRKMEGAVKQVIVNELRPGGVLARR